VSEFLAEARHHDSEAVAEEAVRSAGVGIESPISNQAEICRILLDILDDHSTLSEIATIVVADSLSSDVARLAELQPLLGELMSADAPEARLNILRALLEISNDGGSVSELIPVLQSGLDDPVNGLRVFTLRVIETAVTSGTNTDGALVSLLETALDESTPDVRERAVDLIGTAIPHRGGDLDRLRGLLVDLATDETAAEGVRRAAVSALAANHEQLSVDEEFLETLSIATTADPPVHQAAIEATGTLLDDANLANEDAHKSLMQVLWDGLDSRPVRETAAETLATVSRRGQLDGAVPNSDGLGRALQQFQFSADDRVELVQLRTETPQQVTPSVFG
jgi:hypothetical protein